MKKLSILTLAVSIICISATTSYAGQYWAKTFGVANDESAYSVKQTADGGYIIAGTLKTSGIDTPADIWIIKLNSYGNISWQKTYGGSEMEMSPSIQQTDDDGDGQNDDGYIVTSYTSSYGAGNIDILVLKLDSIGNIIWQKTYGDNLDDFPSFIQQTAEGGYILAGNTVSFSMGGWNGWLLKLDSNGNVIWEKTYGTTGWEMIRAIQQTFDNAENSDGYIAVGTGFFGSETQDVWVLRLDNNGNIIWQKTYGESQNDSGQHVLQIFDISGDPLGYIIAGATQSFGAGHYDIWIMRIDNSGAVVWQKTYGGSDFDYVSSIQQIDCLNRQIMTV